jgi:Spy/CpxP family protein refolding chaperone
LQVLSLAATLGAGGIAMHMAQAASTSPEDGSDSSSFFHHHHCDGSPEKLRAHVDKVLTDAGASDDQKQQVETLVMNAVTAEHADMKQYHESLGQLKTLLTADPIDDAAVATLRAQQDKLALALSERATDTATTIAKTLTPDQRARIGAKIDEMMSAQGMQHHTM